MKVTELQHTGSSRLTQPPVRLSVSPVWRSLLHPSVSISVCRGILLCKHRSLDILDSPSCDIFLVWTPLMSLPAWVIACASRASSRMWRGVRGRGRSRRSRGRQVHGVTQRRDFHARARRAIVFKMTAIIPSGSMQVCPILYITSHIHIILPPL